MYVWIVLLSAYLCGAIPFGVIVGRMRGVDIQNIGSKNTGATNVWRALGPAAGTIVFALDVLKGWAAVSIARYEFPDYRVVIALCAICAVLGHTFSVFLRFKGGKGVATAFGAMLAMVPLVAIVCIACWAVALLIWRTVSIASLIACSVAPLALYWGRAPFEYGLVVVSLAMLAILKHLPNIYRIIDGSEPKIGALALQRSGANAASVRNPVSNPMRESANSK